MQQKKRLTPFKMCHKCATEILSIFIKIENRYKDIKKKKCKSFDLQVLPLFLGFFVNFENLNFPLFSNLREERSSDAFMKIPVNV